MKRTLWIEGLLFLVVSIATMAEGLRLVLYKNPKTLHDVLGPGYYILVLGIGMMATGVVYVIGNYKRLPGFEKAAVPTGKRMRMMSLVAVCAIYIFLIGIAGYLVATLVFFLLAFRAAGIKSWPFNFALTLILTAAYYLVFVQYCEMIFPRGIFFR